MSAAFDRARRAIEAAERAAADMAARGLEEEARNLRGAVGDLASAVEGVTRAARECFGPPAASGLRH